MLEQRWGRGAFLLAVPSLWMGLACSINLWLFGPSDRRAKLCTWSYCSLKDHPLCVDKLIRASLSITEGTLQARSGLFHQCHTPPAPPPWFIWFGENRQNAQSRFLPHRGQNGAFPIIWASASTWNSSALKGERRRHFIRGRSGWSFSAPRAIHSHM